MSMGELSSDAYNSPGWCRRMADGLPMSPNESSRNEDLRPGILYRYSGHIDIP